MQGYSFDVATVLGIGTPDSSPLPEAAEGEIVLRVSEGLSLLSLRDSNVGQEFIDQRQGWYIEYYCHWPKRSVPPGIYRLRVPVPGSFNLAFDEQLTLLYEEEAPAPVAAIAAALLCMQRTGQSDPLAGRRTRSADMNHKDVRVILSWDRTIGFDIYGDFRREDIVGLSSIRRAS